MTSFTELSLQPTTLAALANMNFAAATPVQAQSIPLLLQGRDVLAQARTGTGKTAAFGIPLVEGAAGDADPGVLALVLVPTRELALQVTDQLKLLASGTHVKIVSVYGGVGMGAQTENLRRHVPLIVVATPGRLLDHMNQGNVNLKGVRMLVLDEADRMLDMGFLPDVERILSALPKDRQTALFSATVPEGIRRISSRFMRDPAVVKTQEGPESTPVSEQFSLQVAGNQKAQALQALLTKEAPTRAIIFTRTKHRARSVARVLDRNGWPAVALQGNMSQSQRERALDAFREGRAKILVATDVASRGLDVPETSHVINYDLPDEPEAYVHRIGRTARMGRAGRAFTFVQPDQVRDAAGIERAARVTMVAYEVDLESVELIQPNTPHANGERHAFGQSSGNGGTDQEESPRPRFDNGNGGGRFGNQGGGQRPWKPRGDRPSGGQGGAQRQWKPRGDRPSGGQGGGAQRQWKPRGDRPSGGQGGGNGGPGQWKNRETRSELPAGTEKPAWNEESRGFGTGSQWQGSYGADRPANAYRHGGKPPARKGGYGGGQRTGGTGGGPSRNTRGRGRPRY